MWDEGGEGGVGVGVGGDSPIGRRTSRATAYDLPTAEADPEAMAMASYNGSTTLAYGVGGGSPIGRRTSRAFVYDAHEERVPSDGVGQRGGSGESSPSRRPSYATEYKRTSTVDEDCESPMPAIHEPSSATTTTLAMGVGVRAPAGAPVGRDRASRATAFAHLSLNEDQEVCRSASGNRAWAPSTVGEGSPDGDLSSRPRRKTLLTVTSGISFHQVRGTAHCAAFRNQSVKASKSTSGAVTCWRGRAHAQQRVWGLPLTHHPLILLHRGDFLSTRFRVWKATMILAMSKIGS